MPVDDEINLNKPLTDAQINKLEKDADRMEKAAEKAQEAAQKAQQAIANNPMGGALPMSGRPEGYDTSTLKKGEGGVVEGTGDPFTGFGGRGAEAGQRKGYRRVGESRKSSPLGGMDPDDIMAHMAELKAAQDKLEADLKMKQKEQDNEIKEIKMKEMMHQKHLMNIQGNVGKGFGKANQVMGFMRNPVGFGMNQALGALGKAGFVGLIAAMVIQQVQGLYDQVVQQIKDMYKPGGILDVRKEQLDSLRQVGSLASIIDMEQGRVFFTSGTGEILRQGVPQATNTENRLNGYKQYLQEYER